MTPTKLQNVVATLESVLEYFEDRADCETLMDLSQRPNEEACLAQDVRETLALIRKPEPKTLDVCAVYSSLTGTFIPVDALPLQDE